MRVSLLCLALLYIFAGENCKLEGFPINTSVNETVALPSLRHKAASGYFQGERE